MKRFFLKHLIYYFFITLLIANTSFAETEFLCNEAVESESITIGSNFIDGIEYTNVPTLEANIFEDIRFRIILCSLKRGRFLIVKGAKQDSSNPTNAVVKWFPYPSSEAINYPRGNHTKIHTIYSWEPIR